MLFVNQAKMGVLILLVYFFVNAGKWLLIADAVPENVDILFTFSGNHIREKYAKILYKKFKEPVWVINGYDWVLEGKSRKEYFSNLVKDAIDTNKILWIDTCKNTLSEVINLCKLLSDFKFQNYGLDKTLSVALISCPHHMKRIQMMVSELLYNSNTDFYYLPVPLSLKFKSHNIYLWWWLHLNTLKKVIYEYTAIIYYFFYLNLRRQDLMICYEKYSLGKLKKHEFVNNKKIILY